jgi:hypothetical protein
MTRLLLVTLFTGPINEMPPALNATGWAVGEDDTVVVGCCTCVVDDVVTVEPVVDCPVLVPVPAHAEISNIITSAAVPTSIPWKRGSEIFCIILSVHFKLVLGSNLSHTRHDMNCTNLSSRPYLYTIIHLFFGIRYAP